MAIPKVLIAGFLSLTLLSGTVFAAAAKTYRVTGKVLQVTSALIVIQKGKNKLEFARDPSTKVTGDLKAGSEVTIHYRKMAFSVEVSTAKSAEKPEP